MKHFQILAVALATVISTGLGACSTDDPDAYEGESEGAALRSEAQGLDLDLSIPTHTVMGDPTCQKCDGGGQLPSPGGGVVPERPKLPPKYLPPTGRSCPDAAPDPSVCDFACVEQNGEGNCAASCIYRWNPISSSCERWAICVPCGEVPDDDPFGSSGGDEGGRDTGLP